MTKLIVAFPNFANAPINGFIKRAVRTLHRNGRNFVFLNQAFPWTGEATTKVRTTVGLQIIKMVTDGASDKTFKEIWSSSCDSNQSSDPDSLEKFKAEN
jgi:hypothetical protein